MYLENISSLDNNQEWKNIYATFKKYEEPITQLSKDFERKYNFAEKDIRNAFIYEIMTYQCVEKKLNSFFSTQYLKYSLLFIFIIFILSLSLPIFFITTIFRKTKIIDILYEEMFDKNSWYKRFYSYIDKELNNNVSRAILFTSFRIKQDHNSKNIEACDQNVIDIGNRNLFLNFSTVFKIIIKDSFYIVFLYKLSFKNNINFIYLYLSILRRFILYSSYIADIKSKIMICAGDYYWNPLKYLCYKRNIGNIMLLQHNNKDNYLYGRLFPYCDYYFGHSENSLSKLVGIEFTKKISVGSFQLIPFLDKSEHEFDILFINQTVKDNLTRNIPLLDQNNLIEQHDKLIDNLKNYLQDHKEMNAVYIWKPGYGDTEPVISVKQDFKDIKNIQFIEAYGPETFTLISKSKIIINMYSSVGREAYGLDKKVLWINYKNCCKEFELEVDTDDLHAMVTDNSYKAFEERINLLLSENKEVIEHYKKLKEKHMNTQGNPAKIISEIINQILEQQTC